MTCVSVLLYNSFRVSFSQFSREIRDYTAQMFSLSNTHQVNTCTWHHTVFPPVPLHQLKVHLIWIVMLTYQVGQITKYSRQLQETSRNKWSNASFHPKNFWCALEQVAGLKDRWPFLDWYTHVLTEKKTSLCCSE